MARLEIYFEDNLKVLTALPSESVSLIYVDPPFNTGKRQERTSIRTVQSAEGDRTGFANRRYATIKLGTTGYDDAFEDFPAFLQPRMAEARRILAPGGSLFLHLDYREVHYCKVMLDGIFGRQSFMNEIIWAYDYGARSRRRWPAKHDNILWYAKDPASYTFNFDEMDRIPYMAPGLAGREKASRGKTPTDVWWQTIVSPNGKEKTGYATQKPLAILERIVKIHSSPGDLLCDFFAGSGSFGEAALRHGRDCILVDSSMQAIEVMRKRFRDFETEWHGPIAGPEAGAD